MHLVDQIIQKRAQQLADDPSRQAQVYLHKSDSAEALQSFPDAYFDWIYIDAQHTYEGVKRDIAVAQAKVNSDGLRIQRRYNVVVRRAAALWSRSRSKRVLHRKRLGSRLPDAPRSHVL
jgi:hypothetical protein